MVVKYEGTTYIETAAKYLPTKELKRFQEETFLAHIKPSISKTIKKIFWYNYFSDVVDVIIYIVRL